MNLAEIDSGLMISLTALVVSGLAGIIGMWVERDEDRPLKLFAALAVLCLLSTVVSMWQAIGDWDESVKQEEAMANVLQKLDTIMQKSGVDVPGINDLIKSELADASRNNPSLVKKVARRVADSGGNPAAVLGSYLPAEDVNRMKQGGVLAGNQGSSGEGRKPLQFGGGPTQVRTNDTMQPLDAVTVAASAPSQPVAPPSAIEPPPVPSAAPATPAASAARSKPTTKPSVAPSDHDIYDEAEADLRRK